MYDEPRLRQGCVRRVRTEIALPQKFLSLLAVVPLKMIRLVAELRQQAQLSKVCMGTRGSQTAHLYGII